MIYLISLSNIKLKTSNNIKAAKNTNTKTRPILFKID